MGRPIGEVILDHLERGCDGERFSLPKWIEPLLRRALERELKAADPLAGVISVLKFAEAFDGELDSPSAAARIRAVLRDNPAAVRLIKERLLRSRSLDETRALARQEGRKMTSRAPVFGEGVPAGTMPLRELLRNRRGS
jgi:hypothetical protein